MSKSVLIVDYERRDADAVSRYLQGHGYRATIVTQGELAVRAFREGDFDLVLVNLLMPDVSGVEICKRLKSYEQGIHTPVYFLSPLATGHNMANRQNGAEGTLTKPVNLGQIREIAEKHLGPGDPELLDESRRAEADAKRKEKPVAPPPAEPVVAKSARAVDSRPSPPVNGGARAKESATGVWKKGDEKPSEAGRIERSGMGRLIAQFCRQRSTGRLELESEGKRVAIRFEAGFIVGLGSGDFVPWLVRQGKLTDADAEKVREARQRRRGEVVEVLKAEKMLGAVEVDMLLDRWRIQALKDAVGLKLGDFRFYQGEVTRTIHVDPLILVHHHYKTMYAAESLAAQVDADLRAAKPLFATGDPVKRHLPTDPDLALVMHAADAGASLSQVRDLVPNAREADAAVYALWLTGHITQDPATAWRVPAAAPTPVANRPTAGTPAPIEVETPPEEPIFDLDAELETSATESPTQQEGFGDFEELFDAEFESEFDSAVDADFPKSTTSAEPRGIHEQIDIVPTSDNEDLIVQGFDDLEKDEDFVDPDFEGLAPESSAPARSKPAPRVESPGRRESVAPKPVEPAPPKRPQPLSVDELQAEIDSSDRPVPYKVTYVDDSSPDPHVTTEELLRRGDELMRDRVYSKAQDFFAEVVLREPKNAEAWTRLARAQYRNRFEDRLDRTLDAVRSCRKAIAVKHDFLGAYQTLIKIFEEENKPEIARSVALTAIEYHPTDDELAKRLRTIERRMKRATT